jgi:hypothetical protein
MSHRTTFALDEQTARRLKRLAARWNVSQAEVVRRSLEKAERQTEEQKPNPVEMLRHLFVTGQGLDPEKGNAYIAQVYEDRQHWRDA